MFGRGKTQLPSRFQSSASSLIFLENKISGGEQRHTWCADIGAADKTDSRMGVALLICCLTEYCIIKNRYQLMVANSTIEEQSK